MYVLILTLMLTGDGKAATISHMEIPAGQKACEAAAKKWLESVAHFPMSDRSAICVKTK